MASSARRRARKVVTTARSWRTRRRPTSWTARGFLLLAALTLIWLLPQARAGGTTYVTVVLLAVTAIEMVRPGAARAARTTRVAVCAVAFATVAVTVWTGANSPSVSWFGPTVSHGPRHSGDVALTFDDGPNAGTTLALASILEEHGVRGTFFSVGKAVDARPDITSDLVARGHLVGNHSYRHDSVRWLDPRYPELGRAEHAIAAGADVCPAFFRPPHGQHTPLMARTVRRADMTMVTWDVSATDWSVTDPARIAQAVLKRVRPGSIVDLHDGLDGRVDVDRTVLLRAVPLILDGLAARGLHPVRLDVLLGRPGYLAHC
jgi:peptidoglycan/xylan/chitin deacetylase (PgdA/CDA1 family)